MVAPSKSLYRSSGRRLLFVTNYPAPFQQDVAEAFECAGLGQYDVICAEGKQRGRGKHWMNAAVYSRKRPRHPPDGAGAASLEEWFRACVVSARYSVMVIGHPRQPLASIAQREAVRQGIPYAYWMEPPNLLRPRAALALYGRFYLRPRLAGARFLMGIGDRAVAWFSRHFDGPVEFLPYGEDLSACMDRTGLPPKSELLTFVFSGRLLRRNNVGLVCDCLTRLWRQRPHSFRFILAASGPEETSFWKGVGSEPGLRSAIEIDREYPSWEERLRPFKNGHVLLYPASHSGWGLVIPESMACGCVPITTSCVEAARYFVRDGVSGFLAATEVSAVLSAMRSCLEHRASLESMAECARADSKRGDARAVALVLAAILEKNGV